MFVVKKLGENLSASQLSTMSPEKKKQSELSQDESTKKINSGIGSFFKNMMSSNKNTEVEQVQTGSRIEVVQNLTKAQSLLPSKKNPSDHLALVYEVSLI